MSGPLEGITVVECATWIFGAFGGCCLGDLGADVVKIEERVMGDPARGFRRIIAQYGVVSERNWAFECANRKKRSITLDLRKEDGKKILYELIKQADVFVHNFRLDVPGRLGIDYETLSRYNPQLVYVEATGWGSKGPLRLHPSFEPVAEARAGWMYITGEPDMPPLRFVSGPGDVMGGIIVAQSILAALLARERLGIGQKVEVSLFGSLIFQLAGPVTTKLVTGEEFPRRARARWGNPLFNHYRCADDKWIVFAMAQADRYWPDFCKAVGIEELEKDPRFQNIEARTENAEELILILDNIFATRSVEEWLAHFEQQRIDLIYAPIQTISDLVDEPQARANDYIVDFNHPNFGPTDVVGCPYQFSKTPVSVGALVPELGQHTEEVLLELGHTWDDIVRLREKEVI